jgi:hypothetical protein
MDEQSEHSCVNTRPPPRSAWILLGSEESFHGRISLIADGAGATFTGYAPPPLGVLLVGAPWSDPAGAPTFASPSSPESEGQWTAGPHVEIGDTLFFYFRAPRRAIHFVATAISEPFLDDHFSGLNGKGQWWVDYSHVVRIEPISREKVEETFGEKHFLLNTSFRYIRPDYANRLLERVRIVGSPSQQATDATLRRVVGKSELGDPASITIAGLRGIKSGDFTYEEDVERNFLEPLLRLACVEKSAEVQRRYFVTKTKIVDYAVLRANKLRCVLEVKRAIKWPDGDWTNCAAFEQARGYAGRLRVPFVLVDCDRVACFRVDDTKPRLSIERTRLADSDLTALLAHLLGA